MNKKLKIVLFVILIITVISTASYCSAPYDTETAHLVTVRRTINTNGYIFRKEMPVNILSGSVFEFSATDGDRVSKGSSIGYSTSSNLDNELVKRLEEVTSRISELRQADKFSGLYAADGTRIYSAIHTIAGNIRKNVQESDYLSAKENTRLLITLAEKKYSVENGSAADDLLVSLEEEKYRLEQQLGGLRSNIAAPMSGLFSTSLDGLENVGTEEEIAAFTPSKLKELEKTMLEYKPSNAHAKVIDTYSWYLAATLSLEEAQKLSVGKSIKVSVDESSPVSATVLSLNTEKNSDRVAVIIKGNRSIAGVFEKRSAHFELCLAEHTGLYVPAAAIRVVDGLTGVYIMNKTGDIVFRCVNILMEENDYMIVEEDYLPPEEVSYVALKNYDSILVNPEVTRFEKKASK